MPNARKARSIHRRRRHRLVFRCGSRISVPSSPASSGGIGRTSSSGSPCSGSKRSRWGSWSGPPGVTQRAVIGSKRSAGGGKIRVMTPAFQSIRPSGSPQQAQRRRPRLPHLGCPTRLDPRDCGRIMKEPSEPSSNLRGAESSTSAPMGRPSRSARPTLHFTPPALASRGCRHWSRRR